VDGDIWRKEEKGLQKSDFIEGYRVLNKKFKELTSDISVADFLKQYLNKPEHEELKKSLESYVEGYYAADLTKASTFALRDELKNSSDKQYRVESGYQTLVDYMHSEYLQKGGTVYLSSPVTAINWQNENIEVITEQQKLSAKKIIITVPIGILQSQQINFTPRIENKIAAAKQAGYGPVIKIVIEFDDIFWNDRSLTGKDTKNLGFLFSEETVPTWWTQYPKEVPVLTGWLGGPHAEKMKHLTNEEILRKAITSLSSIFNIEAISLNQKIVSWRVINWATDPFSLGAYSYNTVAGDAAIKILNEPVENKLFFAGEGLHTGPEIGTVEAALVSGRETAHLVIASF
ncbi:MAG: flavin monoamine oxidase family protein, partial [Chitinophagaceae bacterium]